MVNRPSWVSMARNIHLKYWPQLIFPVTEEEWLSLSKMKVDWHFFFDNCQKPSNCTSRELIQWFLKDYIKKSKFMTSIRQFLKYKWVNWRILWFLRNLLILDWGLFVLPTEKFPKKNFLVGMNAFIQQTQHY